MKTIGRLRSIFFLIMIIGITAGSCFVTITFFEYMALLLLWGIGNTLSNIADAQAKNHDEK